MPPNGLYVLFSLNQPRILCRRVFHILSLRLRVQGRQEYPSGIQPLHVRVQWAEVLGGGHSGGGGHVHGPSDTFQRWPRFWPGEQGIALHLCGGCLWLSLCALVPPCGCVQGHRGIKKFFETHKCNDICVGLGLSTRDQQQNFDGTFYKYLCLCSVVVGVRGRPLSVPQSALLPAPSPMPTPIPG